MLKLGPDYGRLGSESGIYSTTVQKVEPVNCADGEMHLPLSVSVIMRRDMKCHISPTEF